ncbi:MAG: EamA family transporter [Patescibacteria group bacterium]|nr:EamA family transporter [Patescibacteria group bacterium]
MNFLPIAILAYTFNGGAILIDKILLRTSLPKPITYTFYINFLQLATLLLIPFGFSFHPGPGVYMAIISGIVNVFALYAFFASLKQSEASVVGPIVGFLNPFFTIIVGGIFLNQNLSSIQYLAFFVLISGAIILTLNLWIKKVKFDKKFLWLLGAGLLFAISYILLREAFLKLSFLDGLIISRASSGFFVLTFLLYPNIRKQIFSSRSSANNVGSKATLLLLAAGQTMGALSGLLTTYGVSLVNPALVNALFGIQYLVILIVSLILARKHPHLLEEKLSKKVIFQKVLGALVISFGLYLLTK